MDKTARRRNYYIWFCFAIVLWLAVAQVLNSTALIMSCLIAFGVFVAYAALKDMAIPVLLFFLPWSTLIKFSPGTMSMYSVMLIVVLLISIIRNSKRFAIMHIFPALLLFLQTMILKQVYDEPLTNSNILFFICLMLFPLLSAENDKNYNFLSLTVFFALGIVSAALISQQLVIFPTIKRYIVVHSYSGYTRMTGFYGDPNYYAAHITAAISGVLLILPREKKIGGRVWLTILLSVLLYCGFLSVAKSFVLIVVSLGLLWFVEILFARGKISSKVTMIAAVMIFGTFLLSSTLFTDLLDQVIGRFVSTDGTFSDLTTGRVDIWMKYFSYFEKEPLVLLFGRGCTSNLVQNRASHNIVIQIIYQFGLIGVVGFAVWLWAYMKMMLRSVKTDRIALIPILMIAIGSIGPWAALDIFFFDEFFLMPFYMCAGIGYIAEQSGGGSDIGNEVLMEAQYEKDYNRK